jgi:hypothetical protein
MPEDWCGVALGTTAFLYLGREGNERSFHGLKARTCLEAEKEAEIVNALDVDIREVFDDILKAGFSMFSVHQSKALEQTLRHRGLTRVVNVTGHDPERFFQYAADRLSPVFGITSDRDEIDDTLRERNTLILAFTVKAAKLIEGAGWQASSAIPLFNLGE